MQLAHGGLSSSWGNWMVEIDEGCATGPTAPRRVRKIFYIDEDVAELLENVGRPNELLNRALRAALIPVSEE